MAGASVAGRDFAPEHGDGQAGWHPVELPRLRAATTPADRPHGQSSRPDGSPALVTWNWGHRLGGSGLAAGRGRAAGAGTERVEARAAIPGTAFVVIGPAGSREVGRRPVRPPVGLPPPPTANDNSAAAGGLPGATGPRTRLRGIARDVFFLIVLAVTLYAAYESGRFAAYQKIIVVPESALPRGRVTRLAPAGVDPGRLPPVAGAAMIG